MVPFAPIIQAAAGTVLDVRGLSEQVRLGAPGCSRLSLSRPAWIEVLEDKVVRPAEAKFNELLERRTNQLRVENV